ncbi:unnamed protein product [Clonostachys rosea]|uniref:Major facilitator superfamily (MFS) profile domain-containing protein n=1 Tax=Bionectria ochroleuca TaxID=29856 RepID=A0ABY6TQL7_BIOOC|nr:unnamed protein product [Clonostachys rosea]
MTKLTIDTDIPSVNMAENVSDDPSTKEHNVPETYQDDPIVVRKLIRKIDWAILPLCILLYLLSFLDRTNIGNARLDTFEADMGMTGLMYNHALAIFFPFYVIAEIPSNMAMKRFPPWIWIPLIMLVWGVCCILMGIVTNYGGLLACRAALGLAEGGLFPGVAYYITMWYCRHECGLRLAVFFSAATLAGAFGGLLARGILEMRGVAGLAGWRWLFIIEGILTVVVAAIALKFMQDYPEKAKLLNEDERKIVLSRLEHDRSSLTNEFGIKYVGHALTDWKIWVHVVVTICLYTGVYSYSLFLPTIVRDLGYSNSTAQLMTVPPFVLACIICVAAGWYADKIGQRGIFMIIGLLTALIGFVMLLSTQNSTAKYIGCFLAAAGIYPAVPQGVTWNSNNIGGGMKRGAGIAMQVGFGNISGIISSYLFLPKDSPTYYPGIGSLAGLYTLALLLCTLMTIYLRRENARRDREYSSPENYTAEQRYIEREYGDNATYFRYTI